MRSSDPNGGRAPHRGRGGSVARMKSQAIDPIRRIPEEVWDVDDPAPSIVELPSAGPLRAGRNTDRWLGAVIAVCAGVLSLGLVGHAATPPPTAPTPSASEAAPPTQELAPETPQAPATAVPAGRADGIGSEELQGGIAPVSVWHVAPIATGNHPVVITVDGYAPSSIEAITVTVRSRSSVVLRSAVVPVAVADERPGTGGERRLGQGTFHFRIVLASSNLVEGCLVETSWRDATTGSQGSTTQVIRGTGG